MSARGLQCVKFVKCCDCGWKLTSPVRQISICTEVSVGSIQNFPPKGCSRRSPSSLVLTLPSFDDGRLAALFYPQADTTISARHVVPGLALSVHQELKRKGLQTAALGGVIHSAILA